MSSSEMTGSSSNVSGRENGGRWNSMNCPTLVALANRINDPKTFNSSSWNDPTEDADDQKDRAEITSRAAQPDFGVQRPEDLQDVLSRGEVRPFCQAFSNRFEVLGGANGNYLEKLEIHAYEVDFRDPEILPTEREARRSCLLGGSFPQRNAKLDFWNEKFGKGKWNFDGQVMWTIKMWDAASTSHTIPAKSVGNNPSTMQLTYKGTQLITEIPKQEAERMLNILVIRPTMEKMGYRSVMCPGGTKWFPNQNPETVIIDRNRGTGEAALKVVYGVQLSIKTSVKNNRVSHMLVVQRSNRLELAENLNNIIVNARRICNEKGLNFEAEVAKYMGRKAYTTYGPQRGIWIGHFHHEMSENDQIRGVEQSFKDYLAGKYNVQVGPQTCMVRQRDTDDTYFCPGLLVLSAKSDDSPLNYGEALKAMSQPPKERFSKLQAFVRGFNAAIQGTNLNGLLSIATDFEIGDLLELANPIMKVNAKGGRGETTVDVTTLPGSWGRSTGGPYNYDGDKVLRTLAIIHEPQHQAEATGLLEHINAYRGMRGIDYGGTSAVLVPVQFQHYDRLTTYKQFAADPRDCLWWIIPESVTGSMIKSIATSAIHHSGESGPQDRGPQLQFILSKNCMNKNAVLGACANTLLKKNNVLFNLSLRNENPLAEAWCFGISVSHYGDNKPTVATISMCPEPLTGTTRSWRAVCHINKPRSQIMPGRNVKEIVQTLLDEAEEYVEEGDGMLSDRLPKVLVVFRDGLADDQLKESVVEEGGGFSAGVKAWAKKRNLGWTPEIIDVVQTRAGTDDFCPVQTRGGRPEPIQGVAKSPVLMLSRNALSSHFMDFLIQPNTRERTGKPKRFIVTRDTMGQVRTTKGAIQLANFIIAQTWNWPYALPFSTGNCAQPAAIKIASKYSELMSQYLTNKDKDLQRFILSVSKNRPIFTITKPLEYL